MNTKKIILAVDLVDAAKRFLTELDRIDPHLQVKISSVEQIDAGQFRDIFRDNVKAGAGVYWFFRPDGTVFDIGKSEDSVWARICAQACKPEWVNDRTSNYEGTVGAGWGFPASSHLRYNADKTSEQTKQSIMQGTFHVGWITVDPAHLASLVEVYLQTHYLAVSGHLPELCYRIG